MNPGVLLPRIRKEHDGHSVATTAYLWHLQFWHWWSRTMSVSHTLTVTTFHAVRYPCRHHVSAVCTAQRNGLVPSVIISQNHSLLHTEWPIRIFTGYRQYENNVITSTLQTYVTGFEQLISVVNFHD